MIEVDSVRRNYGPYDPGFMLAPPHPLSASGTGIGSLPLDAHRALVHWHHHQSPSAGNQPQATLPVTTSAPTSGSSQTKSDEEDDDDDEDRPFTPPPPRERLSYTRYQLELLNAIYDEVRYPNSTQKQLIAKRVGITREQVKIWFQNRRRKDVIGNNGKPKSCDTSTCSTSSSASSKDSSDQRNSPSPDGNESSSSTDANSPKDSQESVVPELVMKSVITELIKFTNDPLKGKKNRKKAKAKQKDKDKASLKKSLSTTLLAGSYDMISPPNQITPTAFFEKVKNGFNHSKNASAFACPRSNDKVSPVTGVSPNNDNQSVPVHGKCSGDMPRSLPNTLTDRRLPVPNMPNAYTHGFYPPFTTDLPVLNDILSYKSNMESRQNKDLTLSSASSRMTSSLPTSPPQRSANADKNLPLSTPLTPGRPLNGIFPYPFLAEQPMLLSSLRQPDHLYRPAPQYPPSHYGDDPYQPLFITSLSNPYYSPPSGAWQSHATQSSSAYTQLLQQ